MARGSVVVDETAAEAALARPKPRRSVINPRWQRRLFLLPAVIIVLAVVIFPTVFGIYVSFTQWILSGSQNARKFIGVQNFSNILFHDSQFWHALEVNFIFVVIGVPLQYVIALILAVLVNQDIRGRKFFRVVFLLPFMMSPVAVGWMIGRSIFDSRWGPLPHFLTDIGIKNFYFFDTGPHSLFALILIDAWYSIPFIFVLLLAGLQAMPHEVFEAARIDGASAWQSFRDMTFPLLLPVSLTAIILRTIFEFKLIDIIIVVTGGGPGNYTETLTAYIYRRGVQGLDVGYSTAMAELFLVIIIAFVFLILIGAGRWVRDVT